MACATVLLGVGASTKSLGAVQSSRSVESRGCDPKAAKLRTTIGPGRRPRLAAIHADIRDPASTASSSFAETPDPPIIELQFFSGRSAADSQTFSTISGEKNLRKFMLENKLEVYALYGKVMNCGGGGTCGTCIVEILEGQELLSARTDAEFKHLKKKPETWRLACQTIVGDKSNGGKVMVQQLPQKQ